MPQTPRSLELFAGIGGFAAAAKDAVTHVGALDISRHVLDVWEANFDGPADQVNLATLDAEALAAYDADLWWMSPPCQPYTVRGVQRDLEDHRAASLINLMEIIAEVRPRHIGMENVEGFVDSQARQRLLSTLDEAGYDVRERTLCPTELGAPAKRERYYLIASQDPLRAVGAPRTTDRRHIDAYLLGVDEVDPELFLDQAVLDKHGRGMRIVSRGDEDAMLNCFTSAYGKTYRFSGSFLREPDGRVRLFDPREILATLHFPDDFVLPHHEMTRRQHYKYVGNSLSVLAMREILRGLLPLD